MLSGTFNGNFSHVGVHHEVDELFKRRLFGRIPSELLFGLCRITPEIHDVGGTIKVGRNLDHNFSGSFVDAFLVFVFAHEVKLDSGTTEGIETELAHRVLLACGSAKLAKKHGAKVVALAGAVIEGAEKCNENGIDAFFPILRRIVTLDEAMDPETAKENMIRTAEQVIRLVSAFRQDRTGSGV